MRHWKLAGAGLALTTVGLPAPASPVTPPEPPTATRRLPVTFDVLLRHAVLVVHGRAEKVGGRILLRVVDVWRGTYAPAEFERQPPPGYLDVRAGPKLVSPGTEYVVFWNRLNQARGGLRQFELVPVQDGKLSRSLGRGHGREELTLAELKARVTMP